MAVFHIEKMHNYAVMSNYHLHNKELTLKAKVQLSQMLFLPGEWGFTLAGLAAINRESIDAIHTTVWELEQAGYIERQQSRDSKGKMAAIKYIIFEQPKPSPKPSCLVLDFPTSDNPMRFSHITPGKAGGLLL